MKILYIASRYDDSVGGTAKRISEKLNENGFDIELMHVPHIPIKNIKNPSFALFGSILSIAKKEHYDIVHAWNVPSAFVMKHIHAKIKVLSIHGVYSDQIGMIHSKFFKPLAAIAEKKAINLSDYLTTDSQSTLQAYKKLTNKPFVHLAGPLNPDEFNYLPKNTVKKNQIIYVGRDSYEKGIDILKSIESQINAKTKYCTTLPWKTAMTHLQESKLLVVPSRIESLPQVIKEAFYLKIPVIATDVGGVSELIQNNHTGILVPPNDPNILVEKINTILADSDLQDKLKENAYNFVLEKYTWKNLFPLYIEFYKQCLND